MSAAVAEDVDYAHTKGAEHNRILKARKLARWLWERDLSFTDVLAADEARRRAWARDAHVTPPSTMDTWQAVNGALVAMEQFAEDHPDHPSLARPHADEKAAWLGVLEDPDKESPAPADNAYTEEPEPLQQIGSETAPILFPRGWEALVAAGPIPRSDARCHKCGGPAVGFVRVNDREVWVCGNHPPQPGEWGALLDWTPRAAGSCAPNRCYCGRCPNFKLGGTGFRLSDSALLDERAAAKGKNRSPVHVRQAAIAAEEARKALRKR